MFILQVAINDWDGRRGNGQEYYMGKSIREGEGRTLIMKVLLKNLDMYKKMKSGMKELHPKEIVQELINAGFIDYNMKVFKNTSLVAPGALAHCLQCRTACNTTSPAKSKMAARGPQKGRRGLERCLPPGFWAF